DSWPAAVGHTARDGLFWPKPAGLSSTATLLPNASSDSGGCCAGVGVMLAGAVSVPVINNSEAPLAHGPGLPRPLPHFRQGEPSCTRPRSLRSRAPRTIFG